MLIIVVKKNRFQKHLVQGKLSSPKKKKQKEGDKVKCEQTHKNLHEKLTSAFFGDARQCTILEVDCHTTMRMVLHGVVLLTMQHPFLGDTE